MSDFEFFTDEDKYDYIAYNKYRYDNRQWNIETFNDMFTEDFINYISNNNDFMNDISDIISKTNMNLLLSNSNLSKENKNKLICLLISNRVNVSELLNDDNREYYVNHIKDEYLKDNISLNYVMDIYNYKELNDFLNNNENQISRTDIINVVKNKCNYSNYDKEKIKLLTSYKDVGEQMVTTIAAPLFWELVNDLDLDKSLIDARINLDNNILQNPEDYTSDSIKKSFCDLYFRNQDKNCKLDIETILNYSAKDSEFNEQISPFDKIMPHIHTFLTKEEVNDESYNSFMEEINIITQNNSLHNIIDIIQTKMYNSFHKEIKDKLTKTKENITQNINKNILVSTDGTNVPFYKIENQTELQSEFLFGIHTTGIDNNISGEQFVQKYIQKGKSNNKIDISLINEGFEGKFKENNVITLGFLNTGSKRILSANTRDGQTNQRKIADGKKRKVIKNTVLPVEDFMKDTLNYNDIALGNDTLIPEPIIPDFILSKSEFPNSKEIEIAKSFNVPIFYVNREKYIQYPPAEQRKNEWYDYDSPFTIEQRTKENEISGLHI